MDVKPTLSKHASRKIYKFTKADWTNIKLETIVFEQNYLETEHLNIKQLKLGKN